MHYLLSFFLKQDDDARVDARSPHWLSRLCKLANRAEIELERDETAEAVSYFLARISSCGQNNEQKFVLELVIWDDEEYKNSENSASMIGKIDTGTHH